jgi:dCMP deaminase
MEHIVIAYIPVFHQGYFRALQEAQQKGATEVWLIGDSLKLELEPQLRKDIRSVSAVEMQKIIQILFPETPIKVVEAADLKKLPRSAYVMPEEDISHALAEKYLGDSTVIFIPTDLRWDSTKTLAQQEVNPDETVTATELQKKFMQLIRSEAEKSIDWWRRVGAVAVKDGKVLFQAHNEHVPSPQEANYKGDPRGNFHKGMYIELSVALHAEANIITQAASQGISLKGCELFVSTFPCPTCSKLIANSGFSTVYYAEGYSMVDGAEVMKNRGIKLIKLA